MCLIELPEKLIVQLHVHLGAQIGTENTYVSLVPIAQIAAAKTVSIYFCVGLDIWLHLV